MPKNNLLNELNVSRETIERLKEFELLLTKWNKSINLISRQEENIWDRHIIDSLQLIRYIKNDEIITDLGSGAGFPGIILGICGYKVNLIESNKKKCAFLTIAKNLCSTEVDILNERIENIKTLKTDIITARGFSNLDNIFAITAKICQSNTRYLLLKGQSYQQEINLAQKNWQFDYHLYASLTENDGKILEVSNIKNVNLGV
jgi:16S rRNA (guanine527-N7)-methyltransferase